MTFHWPYLGTPEQRADLYRHELMAAALAYAGKGLPVFPVAMAGKTKRPLVRWKEGATTDADTIAAWWRRWPLAMIGMPTGARSGLVVLDVDRKGGVDGLANLRAVGVDPYALTPVIARTPSGGLHFYMRYNGPVRNSAGLLCEGVDVRGDGGMVILPPSLPDILGETYEWDGSGAHERL